MTTIHPVVVRLIMSYVEFMVLHNVCFVQFMLCILRSQTELVVSACRPVSAVHRNWQE